MIDKSQPYGTKRLSVNRAVSIFQKELKIRPWVAFEFVNEFMEKEGCIISDISEIKVSYSDDGEIVIQYTENGVNKKSIL